MSDSAFIYARNPSLFLLDGHSAVQPCSTPIAELSDPPEPLSKDLAADTLVKIKLYGLLPDLLCTVVFVRVTGFAVWANDNEEEYLTWQKSSSARLFYISYHCLSTQRNLQQDSTMTKWYWFPGMDLTGSMLI